MKIVIVIPTFNEAENLDRLIPLIDKEIKKFSNHDIHLLVVDGNSPDGTGDTVKKLAIKYPYVHLLLEKEKAGIGAAYIYGFKYAMSKMKADALMEMDADLQHNPKDLNKLIKAFDEGYDYVIGSRYIKGGSIPKDWAFYRKFLSVGGSLFSKFILGMFNVNDFTTGFKISRVKGFVDKIDLKNINSSGFAYKIDLLFKMHLLGAKIKEVPINFGLRDRGSSKMEKDNTLDSLRVVLSLRLKESMSFIRFIVVGFVGLFVDSGSFSLLRLTLLGSSTSSALSGFLGMLTTYTLNNFWSFGDRKIKGISKQITSLMVYFASSYVPIIFRSWLIDFATKLYGDTSLVAYTAFFIGILVGLIWNYVVYSKVIWKRKSKI